MKIFYRISESTNSQHAAARTWQVKLPNATKRNCLLNTMECFPTAEIKVFVDSITDETWNWLHTLPRITIQKIHEGSDAKSMRVLLKEAASLEDNSQIVLFQEDDYLYLPGSEHKIIEALNYSHYATGYLHPDKFWHPSRGGNPFTPMENVSEPTQVIKTSDHFWMITNSTTNTFATTVGVLKEDIDVWMWGTEDLINTKDFAIFLKLREKGRALVQPIPALATHCLKGYEAPTVGLPIKSWEEIQPLTPTTE
jgi:hypothetical protein